MFGLVSLFRALRYVAQQAFAYGETLREANEKTRQMLQLDEVEEETNSSPSVLPDDLNERFEALVSREEPANRLRSLIYAESSNGHSEEEPAKPKTARKKK